MKCPKCGAKINIKKLMKEWGSRGGKKSRRVLSPEDAKKMVEARENKKRKENAGI